MKILSVGLMIGNPENGFQKAMRKVATSGYMDMPCYLGNFNSDLLDKAKSFNPDIIFIQIQQPDVINEQTAIQLSKIGFVINFSGDVRQDLHSWYVNIGKHIQLSTFTNMVDVNKCLALNVNADYLEIGFNPELYKKRILPKEKPYIVAHFNHYNNEFPLSQYRLDICDRLSKEFGDNFGVYGNAPNSKGNFMSNQELESINYNKSKIAINCSHFDFERYSSDRLLRILGSGVMCLSHNFNGIEKDYKLGANLDVFDDLDSLVDKCKYYLENEAKREKIAVSGNNLAHKKFTFDKMCENIIKLYKKHK